MAACGSGRYEDVDVSWYASIVHNCIQEDKLSKLKATLRKFNKEQRRRIVSQKINGNAPLFTSCLKGRVHFVNYLLDDCLADIEQKGIYEVELDHSRHMVTPLWCAAVADKFEVVHTLVIHGADINSPSDTQSTPVRSACYMTNISIVKYLVAQGANIHQPNINGGTCLINSVQSPVLCEFLISRHVDVNAKDNSGNLALHYAIREGRLDTVKLLLEHGSDYRAKNQFGDDALQTAALRGFTNIVKYILEYTQQSVESAIHSLELLGTNFVDEAHDIPGALDVWKKAMEMRFADPNNIVHKVIPEGSNYAYQHVKEPVNMKELDSIVDTDRIYMQALLIRERILGPHHKDTTFGLMYRGAVYADIHRYQRCVDLWKYAYILRHQRGDPLKHECLFTVQALVKLFWEMQVEVESGASDEKVRLEDAVEVLGKLIEQIEDGQQRLKMGCSTQDAYKQSKEDFQLLLQLALHVIHLISRLDQKEGESLQFFQLVHKLVTLSPCGQDGESLLHLSVDPKVSVMSEEFFSPFPSLAVVQTLLNCGANIHAVDDKKNTVLHNSLKFLTYSELQDEGILGCLLHNGAHIDTFNGEGVSALTLMQNQGLPVYPLQYLSLKCLAARIIKKHNIPFQEDIPVSLIPFVHMHG
ncbi:hypothetical protein FSP39_014592 [Pinctada imbricata]|uniref:Uncharacterized protein n=1 Tax=Pinctada imbricata TaxID=66713 RepID=A0AA89BUV1_PINIB|nr:hypothetical protein FSP39_014592 [Pinctada imbricata]